MTTIAYDGRLLSIDSQLTAGGRKMVGTKLIKLVCPTAGKLVVVGAGTWSDIKQFCEWLIGGEDVAVPDWAEFDALVAHPCGTVYQYCSGDIPEDVTGTLVTLGSGSDFAHGALLSGLSAPDAVRVATKADLYSGGAVKTHDTRPKKVTKK